MAGNNFALQKHQRIIVIVMCSLFSFQIIPPASTAFMGHPLQNSCSSPKLNQFTETQSSVQKTNPRKNRERNRGLDIVVIRDDESWLSSDLS